MYPKDALKADHLVITISSILRIIRTHSVARVRALSDTSNGCTTLSSSMFMILLRFIFNPSNLCP